MRMRGTRLITATLTSRNSPTKTRPVAENSLFFIISPSIRFLDFDDDCRRKQPRTNEYYKEQYVAHVENTLADGVEVRQEAQRGDGVHHYLGRPGECVEHDLGATGHKHEAYGDRQNEGDDRVACKRRHAGTDGEETAGHQPAAEVAGNDDSVIGFTQVVHRDPDRERQ